MLLRSVLTLPEELVKVVVVSGGGGVGAASFDVVVDVDARNGFGTRLVSRSVSTK